jgi:hypothetical protein
MKQLALTFTILCAFFALCYAGPERYSGKEMKEAVVPPPCPEWYGDTEWNVGLWGTYAFTGTEWEQSTLAELFNTSGHQGSFDKYLGDDHAWGGGIDLKYFFHRYFGIGLEGYVVDAKRKGFDVFIDDLTTFDVSRTREQRAVGSALGTFTLRYPIHCSRFSPYAWAGGGAIFGGGERDLFHIDSAAGTLTTEHTDSTTEAVGQFGGGLEIRFTRHIGWMNDFSWNVVDGPKNNFGMARSGLNFAF